MTPAQAALWRRCQSGATNPPAPPPPKPRIVAVPGPPLLVIAKPKAKTQRVLQWLDERAASGECQMPSVDVMAHWLNMRRDQINDSISRLASNGFVRVEREGRNRISAIQIVKSGRWLYK